jgi:hypothetical protein
MHVNTITVTLSTSVDLELACFPSVSIAGLTGSFEPTSTTFRRRDAIAGRQ